MAAPVDPYKKRPVPTRLAVLREDGVSVLCEDGRVRQLDTLPKDYRVWGSWDLVGQLWGDGQGQALCWQHRPFRWRHRQHEEEGWRPRHTDVRVLRLEWPEEGKALAALKEWRAWLEGYGAAPLGSLGSTSMSLLRATLRERLWLAIGETPPLRYVIGGRQEMPAPPGRYQPARHYDLPAAYSSHLGVMQYGGHWAEVGKRYPWQLAAARGTLCFVSAKVVVPELPVGPLPRRPSKPPGGTELLLGSTLRRYPRAKWVEQEDGQKRLVPARLQGIWTYEEVQAAADAGCKVTVRSVWIHQPGREPKPFLPWWEAVQAGRQMKGFAGTLAKATGNALWGQFCITPGAERSVEAWSGNRRYPRRHKQAAPFSGRNIHYAPDLAETLTGRIRADLFRCMVRVGHPPLLCAHTDGVWTEGDVPSMGEWREKKKVARLDMLNPQLMRYWRTPSSQPEYLVAGAPDTLAPAIFAAGWEALSEAKARGGVVRE